MLNDRCVGGQNFCSALQSRVQGRTGNKQGYLCNENRIPAMITGFAVMNRLET